MGGCASKPKEHDEKQPIPLPSEAPVNEPEVKAEAVVDESKEEKNNGGEKQNEAPLIDISEPKQQEGDEAKPAIVEPVTADSAVVTELQKTEDKVETAVASGKKEEVKEKVSEAKVEDKSDAPLVTM